MIWGFAFDNTLSGKLIQSQERATRDIHVEIQEVNECLKRKYKMDQAWQVSSLHRHTD